MNPLMFVGAAAGLGALLIIRSTTQGSGQKQYLVLPEALMRRMSLSKQTERTILEMSEEAFAASLLSAGIAAEAVALVCVAGAAAIGFGVGSLGFLAFAIFPVIGVILRLGQLDKKANARRRTFSYALSSYLDLVSVLLAGGAGTETALLAAATTGNSWSFRMLRGTLESARAGRVPAWNAFAELGRRLGVVDLERIAGSMQLAGEQGARVRSSLASQADALRTKQIAEIEANAQAATERMGIPTVLLFVGFIALLGYPALDLVVGQM